MTPFTAIVPVKQFCRSKTRLSNDPLLRASLAKAFAQDVISAAVKSCMIESVVIVTGETHDQLFGLDHETRLERLVPDVDVHVIAEQPGRKDNSLNEALWQGAAWSRRSRPGHPVVVIPADLAAITTRALDETLAIASAVEAAHVVDVEGTGTTLLTALDARDLRSHYGTDSALRHRLAGFSALEQVDARLRRDVDTLADLQSAMTLGIGPTTREVMRTFDLDSVAPRAPQRLA